MSMETYYKNYLSHHGIFGQRWGKRNGPPYPIAPGDHSASEKKAGWKKSIDDSKADGDNKSGFHLSDKQKKYLKVGAVACASALAIAGGAYLISNGQINPELDDLINVGSEAIGHVSNIDISKYSPKVQEAYKHAVDVVSGMNPDNSKTNCVTCSFAQVLYEKGKTNICAKDMPFELKDIGKVFDGAKMNPIDFTRDPNISTKEIYDEMIDLFTSYGEGSMGMVTGYWFGTSEGHALAWKVVENKVIFSDGQTGQVFIDNAFEDIFNDMIPQSMGAVRLDNRDVIEGFYNNFVKSR